MGIEFAIDEKRCSRCGACAADCPADVILFEKGSLPRVTPESEEGCIGCQHCLAICPSAALSLFGRKPEDSLSLKPGSLPSFEAEERLLRGRRSFRQYREESVDKALYGRIVAAVANSPTGCNDRALSFTLVDGKDAMDKLLAKIVEGVERANAQARVPDSLSFLLKAVEAYRSKGEDWIFRGAPELLVVSCAKEDATCPAEDVVIALSYFELLAQSAGLGTVWCGFLKIILDAVPDLRSLLGLPDGASFYAILFGYPAVRYARTVQRDDAAKMKTLRASDF